MKRRSFSGKKSDLSNEEVKSNIESILGSSRGGRQGKHIVTLNEDLPAIAEKLYGDEGYWPLIALKNNLSIKTDRDGQPLEQLRRGQVIWLPDAYEIESFQMNPDAPVVVSFCFDKTGWLRPRTRVCGSCERKTLAMAVACIECGVNMDFYSGEGEDQEDDDDEYEDDDDDEYEDEEDDDDEEEAFVGRPEVAAPVPSMPMPAAPIPSAPIPAAPIPAEPITAFVPRQDQTIISQIRPSQNVPQPAAPTGPPPKASTPSAQPQAEDEDPLWHPRPKPEILDSSVQVLESHVEGDPRSLQITLQLQSQNQWITVYEYQVFPSEVIIFQYHSQAGKKRMKKSLPAKSTKQMAYNHFRGHWVDIVKEFWTN